MSTATRPTTDPEVQAPADGRTRARSGRAFPFLALTPAWVFLVPLIGYPLLKVLWAAFQHANLINTDLAGFVRLQNVAAVIPDPHTGRAGRTPPTCTVAPKARRRSRPGLARRPRRSYSA